MLDLYKESRICQCDLDAMFYCKKIVFIYVYRLVNKFGDNLLMCFMFYKIYILKV